MSILISRSTGHIGSADKMHIIVNGDKVATINENQSIEIELPNNVSSLKVRQFGVGSKEIEVRDGDVLEIKYKRWHLLLLPFMMAVIFYRMFILESSSILPFNILFLFVFYRIKGFYIEHTNIDN